MTNEEFVLGERQQDRGFRVKRLALLSGAGVLVFLILASTHCVLEKTRINAALTEERLAHEAAFLECLAVEEFTKCEHVFFSDSDTWRDEDIRLQRKRMEQAEKRRREELAAALLQKCWHDTDMGDSSCDDQVTDLLTGL